MTVQAFPAPLADFISQLRVSATPLSLPQVQEVNRSANGAIITASLGARLWRGKISITQEYYANADATLAKIRLMSGTGASFLVPPLTHPEPRQDPLRTGLAMPVTLDAVSGDAREVTLGGLTAGYVLSQGDFLSFVYGGLYALHQLVAGGVASGTGALGPVEAVPAIRPGWTAGTPVTLFDPVCKAVMPSTPAEGTAARLFTTGIELSFIQTLR